VVTASGDRADVGGLQDRRDVRAGDRAVPVVGIADHGLERLLAQPVRRQPRIVEHRPGPMPWPAKVHVHRRPEKQLEKTAKIRSRRSLREVVTLALHDVAGEPPRWRYGLVLGEETRVANENAPDLRVLTRGHLPVASDPGPHAVQAGRTVPQPQQLPRIRYPHRHEAAEEPTAHDLVVRVVRLKEERLARTQRTKRVPAARLPEIYFR
jgi:hypothetical protein